MSRHVWHTRRPGLRVCTVCEIEEVDRWKIRAPIYRRRRMGTGLPPPPDEGPGPCPGPPRTSAILMPPRLASALCQGELSIARMPCRTNPPQPDAVAQVAPVLGGPAVGEVRVVSVRHELLGWILWPTYEHPDDPRLSGYDDPEAYIAEHAEAWGVTPDAAAITWVWRIQTEPYREEVARG